METPDYVYQTWLKDAFEGSSKKEKKVVSLLEMIHEELVEVNHNLRRIQGTTPSPSGN